MDDVQNLTLREDFTEKARLCREFSRICEIVDALTSYAQACGAQGALLFVWTPDLVRGLILCSQKTPNGYWRREEEIERMFLDNMSMRFSRWPSAKDRFASTSLFTLGDLVRLMASARRNPELKENIAGIPIELRGIACNGPRSLRHVSIALLRPDRSRSVAARDTLDKLIGLLINHPSIYITELVSTLALQAHASMRLQATFFDEIFEAVTEQPLMLAIKKIAAAFLHHFISLTQSSGGVWYSPKRHSQDFTRTTKRHVRLSYGNSGEDSSTPPMVQQTIREGRPFIINDLVTFFNAHPDLRAQLPRLNNNTQPASILAMPIRAYDHPKACVIAVILLISRKPYKPIDLSAAEYAQDAFRQFTTAYLNRVIDALPGGQSALNVLPKSTLLTSGEIESIYMPPDERFIELIASATVRPNIPIPVLDSDRYVRSIMMTLAAFTPLTSISFRAVSADRSSLLLCRGYVAKGVQYKRLDSIRLSAWAFSTNANVAQYGCTERVDVWRNGHPHAFGRDVLFPGLRKPKESVRGVRSSLTIPVFMGHQLHGVLHMNSLTSWAFGGIEPIAKGLAARLGAELNTAYLKRVSGTFSHESMRWLARHNLIRARAKLPDILRSSIAPDSPAWPALGRALKSILASQRLLEGMPHEEQVGDPALLATVLGRCKDEYAPAAKVKWHATRWPSPLIDSAYITPVRLIISELFENIARATNGRFPACAIRLSKQSMAGVQFVAVEIENSYNPQNLPDEFEQAIFQYPVRDRNAATGGHGALSAAALAHSIGAHLFLKNIDRDSARVIISLWLPKHFFVRMI